jgi:hypothetical protein
VPLKFGLVAGGRGEEEEICEEQGGASTGRGARSLGYGAEGMGREVGGFGCVGGLRAWGLELEVLEKRRRQRKAKRNV